MHRIHGMSHMNGVPPCHFLTMSLTAEYKPRTCNTSAIAKNTFRSSSSRFPSFSSFREKATGKVYVVAVVPNAPIKACSIIHANKHHQWVVFKYLKHSDRNHSSTCKSEKNGINTEIKYEYVSVSNATGIHTLFGYLIEECEERSTTSS